MEQWDKIIQIFEASPTPTSILKADDPDFTYLHVNNAYEQMVDRTGDELTGQSIFKAFPSNPEEEEPDGVSRLRESFQKVIKTKKADELDTIRYDIAAGKKGKFREKYFKTENTPVLDDNNQVAFIINTATDITHEVISERENKLMLNNTEDSFIYINRDLIIQNFNVYFAQNYKEIFGIEVKKGDLILDYSQPERREEIKKIYHQVFKGETIEGELPVETEDGSTRFFNIKYKPAEDKHGNIIGSFVSLLEKTEEHIAKLKLEKNEARFRTLVENGGDVVFILTPDGQPTYISPSIKNVLGYTLEEAANLNMMDIVHPEDVDHVTKELSECLKKPVIPLKVTPARMKHKDGNWHWFEGTITNMLHDPAIGGIVDNFHDITERVEAEEKYRNVVEHSTNMFYQHDTEGVLTYLSPQSIDFLGYPPEEAMTKWTEFITDHPLNKKGEKITIKAIETGDTQPPYELQLRKADGEIIWVEVNETPLKRNDEVVGIVGSLTDITDHKQYEKQLRESLERYDYVSKVSRDAIYDWDIINDHLQWGEGFKTLFGHNADSNKFPIEKWAELIHPEDIEESRENLDFILRDSSMANWKHEYRFKKANGSYAHILDNGYIIRDEDGKAIRMIGTLRDVTEAKQSDIRNQLQQEVSHYFKEDDSLKQILKSVLQYLSEFGGFTIAEIWLKIMDHKHLSLISTYAHDNAGKLFYKESKLTQHFKKGEGLPGISWQTQSIENWDGIDNHDLFIRKNAAKKAGLKSAYGLPLFHNEEFVGVLVFGSKHDTSINKKNKYLFEILQQYLGAEIQRKQQEEEILHLFESAPEIIAIASPHGHFIKVNPAFCKILGYSEEELTSQPFENFVHPDDLEPTKTEYKETITGGRQADNFINRYRTKSGEYRSISWYSSEVFSEDGLVFAFGRDVTETNELEELLNQVQRMAKIGAWEVDLKNEELYWSPITKEIHEVDPNFKPDLETGINFYKEGESRESIQKYLKAAIEKGESWDTELPIITGKGVEKWVRIKGKPEIKNGECTRIYGSFQDIHDRKEAQTNLIEALEEQRRILERINEAFYAVDENWTITYWNKKAEEVVGVSREEVIGQNLWEKFPVAKEQKFFQEYERAFKEQVSVSFEEYYPPLNIWMEVNAYPSKDGLSVFFRDITEKKATEEKIKQTNKKLTTAHKIAKLGYWEFNPETKEFYWSEQAYEIWGFDPDEGPIHFDAVLNRIHPDDKEYFIKQATEEKEPINYEHRILLPDGSVKWLHVVGNKEKKSNGISDVIKGSVQDITEKKKAEIKLAESFKEKEDILESIDDGFFTLDKNWTVTYWNRAAERMLQTPKQTILNQNLWDVFDDAVDLPSYTNYHRAMHERINVDFEDHYPILNKWFDVSAYPSPEGISVFFRDITGKKQAEERIRVSNEKLKKSQKIANLGYWEVNLETGEIYWSEQSFKIWEFDPEQVSLSMETILERMHPGDRDFFLEQNEKAIREQTPLELEHRILLPDGTIKWINLLGNFRKTDSHSHKATILEGVIQEITERKKNQQQLEKLNRELEQRASDLAVSNAELEQFAYVASHDLQEPLRMVSSFLTQLDKKYSDKLDDKANEYINFAVDGAQRMRQIILDLLNYSRLNQDENKREKVNLNNALKEIQSLESSRIKKTGAKISVQKLPIIKANPGPVKQVFQNLLNNALKYQKPGSPPKIEINAEELDTHWKFTIKDNGIGINPEFQENIFQIFQRLHTQDQYTGTGIGLAISKKIVERHDGQIWVESEEGKGSTFYFTIKK